MTKPTSFLDWSEEHDPTNYSHAVDYAQAAWEAALAAAGTEPTRDRIEYIESLKRPLTGPRGGWSSEAYGWNQAIDRILALFRAKEPS